MARLTLADVPGIGPATAESLRAAGIRGVAGLANAPAEKIEAVRGFGPARAAAVKKAAQAMAKPAPQAPEKPATAEPATGPAVNQDSVALR